MTGSGEGIPFGILRELRMTLTREERAWLVSQVSGTLIRKYGSFPLCVTTRRYERKLHDRAKRRRMRKIWKEQQLDRLLYPRGDS